MWKPALTPWEEPRGGENGPGGRISRHTHRLGLSYCITEASGRQVAAEVRPRRSGQGGTQGIGAVPEVS